MPLTIKRTTDAATEPVTTDELKVHMRIGYTNEDALIASLITAARQHIEELVGRAFIDQTWTLKIDYGFPAEIHLPRSPLSSVTTFTYVDQQGTSQTVPADRYTVDSDSEPARIYEARDKTWPTTWSEPLAVTVVYVAGYGSSADDVPDWAKVAIKLLAAHWFRNRETAGPGTQHEIPHGVESLIAPHTVFAGV